MLVTTILIDSQNLWDNIKKLLVLKILKFLRIEFENKTVFKWTQESPLVSTLVFGSLSFCFSALQN